MNALRAIWRFIKTVIVGLWRFLRGLYRRFVALVAGIFGPPTDALARLLRVAGQHLDAALEFLLTAWRRLFQAAPKAPRDRRQTPGRAVLPLVVAIPTLVWWYVIPWLNWFSLDSTDFERAVYISAIALFMLLRFAARAPSQAWLARFLVAAERRVGLIWFERLSLLAAAAATVQLWSDTLVRPAPLLVAIGFFVINTTKYEPRTLADDLPDVEELGPTEPGPTTQIHTLRWKLDWPSGPDNLDISVVVDVDRYERMKSTNPGAPADFDEPDFTPWVVTGATPEVDRTAAEIRRLSNQHAYSRFQEAASVLAMVQSLTYSLDEDTTGIAEYWRYPIETVHEETGDCEDTTILAAAVLRRLGHKVLPLLAPGHAALGIVAPPDIPGHFVSYDGGTYYYCETTADGFKIGELPVDIDPGDLIPAPLRD